MKLLYKLFIYQLIGPLLATQVYSSEVPKNFSQISSHLESHVVTENIIDNYPSTTIKTNSEIFEVMRHIIEDIFKQMNLHYRDPLLYPEDDIYLKFIRKSQEFPKIKNKYLYQDFQMIYFSIIDDIILEKLKEIKALELEFEKIKNTDPKKAIRKLEQATNLMERIYIASGFDQMLQKNFSRLHRKLEKTRFKILEEKPQRYDHQIVIPTMGDLTTIEGAIKSIIKELKTFEFGKYDNDHRLIITIIEDNSNPMIAEEKKKKLYKYQEILSQISPYYILDYWSEDRQEALLDRINKKLFNDKWDIRETLQPDTDSYFQNKKGYARIRTLGLIIAKANSLHRPQPDNTIVHWIDDDARVGTTVIHRNGLRESNVNAYNFFLRTQETYSDQNIGLLRGLSTYDSGNVLKNLTSITDFLYALRSAKNKNPNDIKALPQIPHSYLSLIRHNDDFHYPLLFSEAEKNYPMTEKEYLLEAFNTFQEFKNGTFPFRITTYFPNTTHQHLTHAIVAGGKPKVGSGNNASFLLESMETVLPYFATHRGEDALKTFIDTGSLKSPDLQLLSSKEIRIDNMRLDGRIDIFREMILSYKGRITNRLFVTLMQKILEKKEPYLFYDRFKITNFDHHSLFKDEYYSELQNAEEYITFDDWLYIEEKQFLYIEIAIKDFKRVMYKIFDENLLERKSDLYFWLQDPDFQEPIIQVLKTIYSPFKGKQTIPELVTLHNDLNAQKEAYESFIEQLKRYGRNVPNWKKFWTNTKLLQETSPYEIKNTRVQLSILEAA